jgi:hypothetical protein
MASEPVQEYVEPNSLESLFAWVSQAVKLK